MPKTLISDNGPQFISHLLAEVCDRTGIKHILTTPYHPQSNFTERVNRTLGRMIAAYIERNHKEWDTHISELALALRTSEQDSTKYTPAKLHLGREIALPWDRLTSYLSRPTTIREKWTELQQIRKQARDNVRTAQQKQRRAYNLRWRPDTFKVGSLVVLKAHPISSSSRRFSAKLAPKWSGPYEIAKIISSVVYDIKDPHTGASHGSQHIANLKRYTFFPKRKTTTPLPETDRGNDRGSRSVTGSSMDHGTFSPSIVGARPSGVIQRRLRPIQRVDYRQLAGLTRTRAQR
ncbi:uncharacterized protein LOC111616088 [Centruroides sculpturatus]|uniref:uncharacterized protein LOC111616088 n=1 Tax=Centruroides sculpturatus TaxID=218467 RepID=UPI000C6EEE06|nr:uncharacterized protein LOC111616088 [Centruroides sculpturatus]